MKSKLSQSISVLLILSSIIFVFSCNIGNNDSDFGSLTINLSENVSRTLLPEISMEVVSYEITGTGPDDSSFTRAVTDDVLTVEKLAFGLWNVSVTAFNADGTAIGSGNSEVTVHSNETSEVSVTVVPFTGDGSLNLTLNWTDGDIETPQVTATLLPETGEARILDFTINGVSATFSSTDIPAGYHTLTVQLSDNGALTMGTVEVVRIVKDQTTTGVFTFDQVNKPGGTISVNIVQEMADPLVVSIENSDRLFSASVQDYTDNVTYVWYVNGNSTGTGETFNLDSTYELGFYNVSVTAFNTDGTRAGSNTLFVETSINTPTTYNVGDIGPTGGWIFYDDEADGVDDMPGYRYLEAASSDILENKAWGTYRNEVLGADGTAIGTGAQNTLDIIAGDPMINNAAHFCSDYSVDNNEITYSDWFLPSKDELNAMYNNLKINGLGDFVDNYYWSSSEYDNYYAWNQTFYNGNQYSNGKDNSKYVRPVRAF